MKALQHKHSCLNPSCRFFLRMAKFYYSVAILFGRQPVIIQFQNYIPTNLFIQCRTFESSYYFLAVGSLVERLLCLVERAPLFDFYYS